MAKVGVGARDHETEVTFAWLRGKPDKTGYRATNRRYRAVCSCGWTGGDHTSRRLAEDDEFAHMTTEEDK